MDAEEVNAKPSVYFIRQCEWSPLKSRYKKRTTCDFNHKLSTLKKLFKKFAKTNAFRV